MPTINQLSAIDVVSSGDQIPVYAPNLGDARRLSVGALTQYIEDNVIVPNNAANVTYDPAGTGAVARTVQAKLRDVVSVKDFGAKGDGATDDTLAIQAAIDYCSTNMIGTLYAPPGTYIGNWIIKKDVIIQGAGAEATRFVGLANAPTFKTLTNVATVRIGWRDCKISGNLSNASNTGITIGTTTAGTWVDTVHIDNVVIDGCGSYGLYAFGTSTSGPFVQNLRVNRLLASDNVLEGVFISGVVIETTLDACIVANNGPSSGLTPNMKIARNGTSPPGRISIRDGLFNHQKAAAAGNEGIALLIDGAQQVSIQGSDFENSSPMIQTDNALTSNLTITGNKFSTAYPGTSIIKLNDLFCGVIENNQFNTVSTLDYYIWQNSGGTRVNRLRIGQNIYGNAVTVREVSLNRLGVISSKNMNMYAEFQYLTPAAPTDLENIYDADGGTGVGFYPGQIITIAMDNSNTVTVKHNVGNIRLQGAVDYAMTTFNTLTLVWSQTNVKWIEVARNA